MIDINHTRVKCLCISWAFILLAVINGFAQIPAKKIPPFSFQRLDKRDFTNKDLQNGKLLFFVFFDTQCDHCQRSIQYIGQHYNQFRNTAIYLITLDSAKKIGPFINKYGTGLKNKKNVVILLDTRNEFIQKFGPRKYPSLFLYSSKKELVMYDDNEQHLPGFINRINKIEPRTTDPG